jgi:acetolactate synthase-1/2/3 large subunit
LGKDSFQEIDIAGVTMPITKHNFIVKDVNDLADIVRQAFEIANTGRPGPVLIDIPKDITSAEVDYEPKKPKKIERQTQNHHKRRGRKDCGIDKRSAKTAHLCRRRGDCLGCGERIESICRKNRRSRYPKPDGHRAYPATDPNYTGMVGMHAR